MEHVTRTQEIMSLLSLDPEIQVEMSRPRSWAADNGAAAREVGERERVLPQTTKPIDVYNRPLRQL